MVRSDQYSDFFAEFYDILHAGLSDVDCYIRYAERCGRPSEVNVLELGCGTGRILIPLANAGFPVTGVDLSDDMLALCKMRLSFERDAVQSRTRIVKADVTQLALGEKFDLVIAPCNFLNHFLSPADAGAVLRRAKEHLKNTGTLVLDHSIPNIPWMVASSGITQTFEFTHPLTGTTIIDRFTATYDFVRQLETNHIALEEYSEGDLLRKDEAVVKLTYYFPREIRLMLEAAGFEIVHEQGSLEEDRPIDDQSGEMVFFCRSIR